MRMQNNGAVSRAAAGAVLPGERPIRFEAPRDGVLFPLDAVYERGGVVIPKICVVAPEHIPYPYRTLLVHTSDMTLTLERHFGGPLVVRPLSTARRGSWYVRRVLLAQSYSGRPVEMGAIRINVKGFSEKLQRQIFANVIPLGRLLRDGGVDFESRPRVFFAVLPNAEMMGVFWMREPRTLYGRRTEVFVGDAKIGDIVEILPLV
jgi:hypothetical protein